MARPCRGAFSEETRQRLKDAFLEQNQMALLGRHVLAENKAGEWVPRTHEPARPYRSGKRTGEKR
jgi:hypothetical protein